MRRGSAEKRRDCALWWVMAVSRDQVPVLPGFPWEGP